MKPAATTAWLNESSVVADPEVGYQPRFTDPDTGVRPLRLTTLPVPSTHIYPEMPVSSPDGRRFIFRRVHPLSERPTTYWVCDLDTLRIRQVTDEPDASVPLYTPDGRSLYYCADRTIIRMCPETFEREPLFTIPDGFRDMRMPSTVSRCGSRLAASWRRGDTGGLVVIDLPSQTCHQVFSRPDCVNGHEQYCRFDGRTIMFQVNDGILFDAHGNTVRLVGDDGASLHIINEDGTGHSILNVGRSPLEHVQGHQCWLGDQDAVLTTLHRRDTIHDPWRQNRIVAIGPGDASPRIVAEGTSEAFTHIHTTPDGRYWVSDCNRTATIYVGSTTTNRYKLFTSSGASFGAHQSTHPHPFFIGNGAAIGWNSDVTGIPQIYAAHIPAGFLDDL